MNRFFLDKFNEDIKKAYYYLQNLDTTPRFKNELISQLGDISLERTHNRHIFQELKENFLETDKTAFLRYTHYFFLIVDQGKEVFSRWIPENEEELKAAKKKYYGFNSIRTNIYNANAQTGQYTHSDFVFYFLDELEELESEITQSINRYYPPVKPAEESEELEPISSNGMLYPIYNSHKIIILDELNIIDILRKRLPSDHSNEDLGKLIAVILGISNASEIKTLIRNISYLGDPVKLETAKAKEQVSRILNQFSIKARKG